MNYCGTSWAVHYHASDTLYTGFFRFGADVVRSLFENVSRQIWKHYGLRTDIPSSEERPGAPKSSSANSDDAASGVFRRRAAAQAISPNLSRPHPLSLRLAF